nr:PREDICTED: asialoglycoprotein receptor 2-like [Latimeria chalumnae]|eukprot:XP_014341484.1 PREDICTED: asialoglycoprotein receptor 2-like [Latimeria chalumnae]
MENIYHNDELIKELEKRMDKGDLQVAEQLTILHKEDSLLRSNDSQMAAEIIDLQEEDCLLRANDSQLAAEIILLQEEDSLLKNKDSYMAAQITALQEEDVLLSYNDSHLAEELKNLDEKQSGINDQVFQDLDRVTQDFRSADLEMNTTLVLLQQGQSQLQTKDSQIDGKLTSLQGGYSTLQSDVSQMKDQIRRMKEYAYSCSFCPGTWNMFSGKCYYFSTDSASWYSARSSCLAQNGDLVIVKSTSLHKAHGNDYWIGLTDSANEGSFQWVDGTPLSGVTFWAFLEPISFIWSDEDCVHMKYDGSWNDNTCSVSLRWICEKNTVAVFATENIDSSCTRLTF